MRCWVFVARVRDRAHARVCPPPHARWLRCCQCGHTHARTVLVGRGAPHGKAPRDTATHYPLFSLFLQDSLAGVSGISGRYATALFQAGKKAGKLDAIDKDLAQVREREREEGGACKWGAKRRDAPSSHPALSLPPQLAAVAADSPSFAAFLRDRSIAKGAKAKQLSSLLADAKVSDVTKNFFAVLTDNNRLAELPRVVEAFRALLAVSKGQVTATVTTADPLTREEEEEVKKGLTDALPKGRTLNLVTRVNPALIGGLVVDIGDKHIDLSIASRVKQVQQLLASGTTD